MSVGELLSADRANERTSLKVFQDFDPGLETAFDDVASMFRTVMHAYGLGATDDHDQERTAAIVAESGESERDLLRHMDNRKGSPRKLRPSLRALDDVGDSVVGRQARGALALAAFRCFMYAATDLRRLRVTTATGFLRVEIEAVALMNLFVVEPARATQWHQIRTDEHGRSFYGATRGYVERFRKTYDLERAWQLGSGASQHARVAGLVDGMDFSTSEAGGRRATNILLRLQDFREDAPEEFVSRALFVLRTQEQLLIPLDLGLPEASDPVVREGRFPRFRRKVDGLYAALRRKYPDFVAKHTTP